jgi:mono/diheme cytochrome c family protein
VAEAEVAAHVRCETRDHYYPGNDECMACHTRSAHFVLGASTRQWNREVPADATGAARINQLVAASRRALFDVEVQPTGPAGWKRLVALDDAAASLQDRARSYLDANCSQCHRPGVVVQTRIDARFDTPLAKQGLIDGRPRSPSLPNPDELIVVAKDLERSRIYTRVRSRRMPPLGSVLPNEAGLALLKDWIMSLDGPPALVSPAIGIRASAGGATQVTLSHPDPAAAIHYTTDDTAPSPETPRYAGPLEIKKPTVIRAAAYRDGFATSRITSREVSPAVTP